MMTGVLLTWDLQTSQETTDMKAGWYSPTQIYTMNTPTGVKICLKMQVTKEQLEIIERAGAALCKPSEVARLAGIAVESFKQQLLDEESEIYTSYFSAFETTKLELKESTIAIAKQGSSPAQTLAFDLLRKAEMEMEED